MNSEGKTDSTTSKQMGRGTRARVIFRWVRIVLLTILFFAAAVLLWCNYVQVPRAIASLLSAELRQRNLNLEFSGLRLRGFTHLVAREFRFATVRSSEFPYIEAHGAEFMVDFGKLLRGNFALSGLKLEEGSISLPIHALNSSPRYLVLSNVVAEIDLLPEDVMLISQLSGAAFGAEAHAAGYIRNYSRLTQAPPRRGGAAARERWKTELRNVVDVLESLRFAEPPNISMQLTGDAADLDLFQGSLSVTAQGAESQWGSFERLSLSSSIYPARTNKAVVAGNFQLNVGGLRSRWGSVGSASAAAETVWAQQMNELVTNGISLSLTNLVTRFGTVAQAHATLVSSQSVETNVLLSQIRANVSALESETRAVGATEFEARLNHTMPFPTPAAWLGRIVRHTNSAAGPFISGDWRLRSSEIRLARSTLDAVELSGAILSSNSPAVTNPSLGVWAALAPWQLRWKGSVSNILAEQIKIGEISGNGEWTFPSFKLNEIEARLYDGIFSASSETDVSTRAFKGSVKGEFDYQRIAQLLDRPVQDWLQQFAWERPPFISAELTLTLPPWTNSWERANREILQNVAVSGRLAGTASYRGIAVQKAEGRFYYSNFVWRLPELLISRPEGITVLDYTGNVTNADFSCRLEARLDPAIFGIFVPEDQKAFFDLVSIAQAPLIVGEAIGNWDRPEEMSFRGTIAITNFSVRAKPIDDLAAQIFYSNQVLEAWNVTGHMGTGAVHAPYLRLDILNEVIFVTNAVSTVNPYDAMYMAGPLTYNAIDPYRYTSPPRVVINGMVPLGDVRKADLSFDVAGEEFRFWRFHVPNLTGNVRWRGFELWITNAVAAFYTGKGTFEGYFKIHEARGDDSADFRFIGTATNSDLKLLVADLFGMTNQMEGTLNGHLVITSANSDNIKSWNGYGEARMHDGFLWSVPVFGVFTPMLDAIVPGAAMSRVTAGTGNFNITNSVVHTRDLQVRTRAFRLNYKGSVDLEGTLDALVEAEILRDAWIVGKAFSLVLWPVSKAFEAKISGNVNAPKTQLRYFKLLWAPFRALNALGDPARKTPKQPTPLEPSEPKPKPSEDPAIKKAGLGPESPRPPSP